MFENAFCQICDKDDWQYQKRKVFDCAILRDTKEQKRQGSQKEFDQRIEKPDTKEQKRQGSKAAVWNGERRQEECYEE